MKKTISFFIAFSLFSITTNAQEITSTLSAFFQTYDQTENYGISADVEAEGQNFWGITKEKNHTAAWVNNLALTNTNLKIDTALKSIKGFGIQFDTGFKGYLAPNKNHGFYFEYFVFTGGYYSFDDIIYYSDGTEKKFKGKYSYMTFLNPGLGYKLKITKNINIDFYSGIFWRGLSDKDEGDVDEKMFKDFIPRFGFKAGWLF